MNTITKQIITLAAVLFLNPPFSPLLWRGAGGEVIAQTQIGADIDGEAANDYSGYSGSMPDANTVAIGALNNDGNGSNAGHVRIYTWNGSAWVQKGADIDGETWGDASGYSVSMPDANTVAIGAVGNDGSFDIAGHVRIYTWNGSAWAQKGADIDGEAANDYSGYSVSMPDANTVAIGAPNNNGGINGVGHVRVYTWNGSAWVQKGADIDGEAAGDWSGNSVSMPDAGTVAIGAYWNDGTGNNAGHVRIYAWNGSAWAQKGADIDGEAAGDLSGWSVSMPDANTVAIGARLNAGAAFQAGHVRIYTWNGSAWVQKGIDIDGEAAGDWSGYSVSMPDASAVAIGAVANAGSGAGAGHVRVYTWNGSAWALNCADIDGEATNDGSGRPVSMPDANTVAIGAWYNDGSGADAGHVRVYDVPCAAGLPIELLYFNAKWLDVTQTDALLQWATASEQNNDYFTVERSTDGINFTAIATTPGAGNSSSLINYQYIDNGLPEKTKCDVFYYRLKQTDYDGAFTYSKTEVLTRGSITVIDPAPNPINDELNFTLLSAADGEINITFTNMLGQSVKKELRATHKGIQQIKIPLALASGMYMLFVETSDGVERIQKQFVIK